MSIRKHARGIRNCGPSYSSWIASWDRLIVYSDNRDLDDLSPLCSLIYGMLDSLLTSFFEASTSLSIIYYSFVPAPSV